MPSHAPPLSIPNASTLRFEHTRSFSVLSPTSPEGNDGIGAPTSAHPLSARTTAHWYGDGVGAGMPTRPSLRRVLEGSFGLEEEGRRSGLRSRSSSESGGTPYGSGRWSLQDDETIRRESNHTTTENGVEVLVHEIGPKDSLAGVALKYGVPLSTLRRANKLWASDSIHLRRTLYIPLTSAPSRPPLLFSVSADHSPVSRSWKPSMSSSASSLSLSESVDRTEGAGRKIVPRAELSFFPPPSSGAGSPARARKPLPSDGPNGSHYPATMASASGALARPQTLIDLFRALPDVTGIARRSTDSSSSGREEGPDGTESGIEMEMDERKGRKMNEPMKKSEGMIIRRGGARARDNDDEVWL